MCSNKLSIYIYLFFLLFSCKKDKKEYEAAPVITFKSISPSPVTEYQPILITFEYTDGDGDLGENNANVKNLFVTDNRIGITYSYRIQQLSPANSIIAIQGTMEAKIENAVITNNAVEQYVNYSLYVTDRAGHKSNIITTTDVLIKK